MQTAITFLSALVWYVGVRIATAWFFLDAGALERTRSRRFWIGDAVSSIIVLFLTKGPVLVGDIPAPLRQRFFSSFSSWTGVIDLSAIIYVVGILGGLYNAGRWARGTRKKFWTAFKSGNPSGQMESLGG
jgi:hypothetical protein